MASRRRTLVLAAATVAVASGIGLITLFTLSCGSWDKKQPRSLPPLKLDPFAGLDPLGEDAPQQHTFRKGPKPPPSTTRKEQLAFPASERNKIADAAAARNKARAQGPLKVTRFAPKDGVKNVGAVTVTFSQPMVPVASLAALKQLPAPIEITPKPPGRFRWLGTQTVAFEPGEPGKGGGRMPYATDYVVKIPAGTRSAIGGKLERTVRFAFSTPRVKIKRALPSRYGAQARPDTAIAIELNQAVDPKRVLELISIDQLRGQDLELVPRARWEKLRDIGQQVATWEPDRTVVLQPRRPLSTDTAYRVSIAPGLRGEGPKQTTATLHHYFRTYAPLRVEWIRCTYRRNCRPSAGFYARFNNPLVTSDLQPFVRLDPPVKGELSVRVSGNYAYITGDLKPQTRYAVTIANGASGKTRGTRGPVDIHDQRLSQDKTVPLRTGDLQPQLKFPVRGLATLERTGKRQVPLEVVGVGSARVRMVRVAPEQIFEVIRKASYSYDDNGRRDPLKGIKGIKVRRTMRTGVARNGKATLAVNTDEALGRRGAGPVYIELRSDDLKRESRWANPFRGLVVQVTDIGIMARYGNDRIVALVSDMQSGKPIAGAKVALRDRTGKVIWRGSSDGDGVVRAPGRRALTPQRRAPFVLWASHGSDRALLILDQSGDDGGYLATYSNHRAVPEPKRLKMHLFTDRSPYRPKETVHLKGVLRVVDDRPTGGVEPLPASTAEAPVRYEIKGPRGHKLKDGKAKLSPSGAFAIEVKIPEGADLGAYAVRVQPTGGPYVGWSHGSFQVQEYRPPEFKVKVEVEGEPYFAGAPLRAKVGADYLFGAPMSGARCKWTLSRKEASFAPPGQVGFSFGEPLPYRFGWRYRRHTRRHRLGRRAGYGFVQQSGTAGETVADDEGRLDDKGRLIVKKVKLVRDTESKRVGPLAFTLEAQVFDQNRQSLAGRKVVTVHPASVYVGLRAQKRVIKAGGSIKVEGVLVDLQGKRIAGRSLTVEALKVETKVRTVFVDGRWTYRYESKDRKLGSCSIQSGADVAACEVRLPKPGSYTLRVAAKDDKGRTTRTALRVYAFGPGYVPWNLKNQSKIELVPDKKQYRVGDVAKILVKSPLRQAIGLLSIQRGGIEKAEVLRMAGNAQVIEVPIAAHHLPEVHVAVGLARGRLNDKTLDSKQLKDLGRPTFAHGTLRLPVSTKPKQIALEAKPAREAVGPGDSLRVSLRAKGPDGKPARAELAVMLVDEGVLSLLGYQTPDPLAVFHASRSPGAPLADLRNALLGKPKKKLKAERRRKRRPGKPKNGSGDREERSLSDKDSAFKGVGGLGLSGRGGGGSGSGYGRGAGRLRSRRKAMPARAPLAQAADNKRSYDFADETIAGELNRPQRIRSRSHFATTAYYNPSVLTDEQGRAEVTVKMPDNLTTYRIMVVALDADRRHPDRFGHAEAQVKVRKPLLLRPSLPRFLSVGDRFEAAVMVHNETDKPGAVDVLVRGRNAVPEAGKVSRVRVEIPAHGAKEVRFPMKVRHAGPARIQFAAVLGKKVDAVEKQLPVLLPATTEAFATYGMTSGSVAQPVQAPKDALPGYGGLEVSISSTALNGLEDAVRYLVSYPHECTEQTASRLLPIFSLRRILDEFSIAKLKDRKQRDGLARAGVRRLVSYQRYDGGWGNWQGSRLSWLYTSAYATFALHKAKLEGEQVPDYNLRRAKRFLKRRLDRPLTAFGEHYHYTAQAAAVWVLAQLGQYEKGHLSRLYGLKRKLPLFARAWLMEAVFLAEGKQRGGRVEALLREIDNAAVQTASAAHFAEGNTESLRLLMHSNDRTDAIVLHALLEVAPKHPLMPKLARGLLQARVRGRWSTTQANAYALVALARYYKRVEKVVPDFVSQIWYGDGYMGQGKFAGRQMKVVSQNVPLSALSKAGDSDLVLAKRGQGKLYYRIGLRYAPSDLRLPPEEQGFSVTRLYEPIRDPDGSEQKTVERREDGSWQIKAGATVRVRLVVVVPDRRYFVAIVDPLPAGLEGINLAFKTSAQARLSSQLDNRVYDSWSWYSLLAFDHKEMRDDRVVLFADRLPAGVYEYTYLARATSYGTFVAAPTKAEEMYHPETFGRTGTTFVRIK